MVMDHIQEREKNSSAKTALPPNWVSEDNASSKAWKYVEELKKEKSLYIKRHSKVTHFSTKKTYFIKGADVSNALGINRTSLMNTSSFSADFREYLDGVNKELVKAKDAKIKNAKKNSSRGTIRNNKAELVQANTELRKRLKELEAQKTAGLVARAFDELPLLIKKKIGIF